ncbi:ATP-binding protein [Micromonospora sediminimaris]|uniref:ATP-binding protein n=1 Tax=Micromonospora sediminimaris TaxID=547162 RepID=UPI0037974460
MTTDVLGLIAVSADRWRYPELAAALAGGNRTDLGTAVTLLLDGIARPRDLAAGITAIIADGRYSMAEVLLIEVLESAGALGDDDLERLESDLELSRAAAVADVERAWADLNVRASEVGLPAEDGSAAIELAAHDRTQAQRLLGERGRLIAGILDDRLAERLRDDTPQADAQPWEDAVRDSVRLGEFGVATSLLSGTTNLGEARWGPLTVRPVRWQWPWRERPVTDVLAWYAQRWAAPPEFAAYRPPATDIAAQRLVAALTAVSVQADPDVVTEFGAALAGVLEGVAGDAFPAGSSPGFGVRIDFADSRMSGAEPFTRRMTVWVSAAGEPPDAEVVARPLVWFRPVMAANPAPGPGVATLDVSTLLRLIAPVDGFPGDAAARRINLLRLLLPQLEPADVLTPGLICEEREDLAWLLDAFGLTCDAAVLDGLMHDFASSPAALRQMLDGLIAAGRDAGQPGPVGIGVLRRVAVGRRAAIRDAVFSPLAADTLAQAVLWLILHRPADGPAITADTMLAEFREQGLSGRGTDWMVNRATIAAALDLLAGHGLLATDSAGQTYRPPAPGLVVALRDPSGPTAAERTRTMLEAITKEVRRQHDATAAVLGPRVTHLIGHRLDNDVIGVIGKLDRAVHDIADEAVRLRLAEVRDRIMALGGGTYVDLYWSALAPPEPVEMTGLLEALVGTTEWQLPDGVRTPRPTGQPCWVRANPALLQESLRNLIVNSAQALSKALRRHGVPPGIQVSVDTVDESAPRRVPLTGSLVVVEVMDNGPGFSAGDLDRATRAADAAEQDWNPAGLRNGSGQGIPLTASMLRRFGGVLEVRNSTRPGQGGVVSAWLPRLKDPIVAESLLQQPRPAPADHAPAERRPGHARPDSP